MAKSQVQVSYDLSSGDEDDQGSDTTAESEIDDNKDAVLSGDQGDANDTGSGSNGDDEDGDEEDEDEEGNEEEEGGEEKASTEKSGLADVMAKILRKQAPADKPVILSKGLTDKELRLKRKIKEAEQTDDFQKKKPREDESSDDEHDPSVSNEERLKKRAWEELGRRKVDITQREPERRLQRIATKGVLQLFNAVRKQQKMIEDKLRDVGSSERRKDDVMKSLSKGEFLDMLKTTPNVCDEPAEEKTKKLTKKKPSGDVESDSDEDDGESGKSKPSWSILRDDFMMGAKMKDWDKEEDDDEGSIDGPDDDVMSSGDES